MAKGKTIYREDNILVTYNPASDIYILFFDSPTSKNRIRLFINQNLLDSFSNKNVNNFSAEFGIFAREAYVSMSKSDIKKIHKAIKRAKETHFKGLARFVAE